MTNNAVIETTFQLLSVRDVRPVDWFSGERVAIPDGELPECARCGRRHAVVWTLRELPSGGTVTVGSGCGPKLLAEGLLPGVDLHAVAAAKKVAAAEVRAIRRVGAEVRARELAELARAADLSAGDPPAPVWTADVYGRAEFVTVTVGAVVRCAVARQLDRVALERMAASQWRDEVRMAALLAAGCPRGAQYAVIRLANAETESTLRDAAASLLP